jgi:hypothetical protein
MVCLCKLEDQLGWAFVHVGTVRRQVVDVPEGGGFRGEEVVDYEVREGAAEGFVGMPQTWGHWRRGWTGAQGVTVAHSSQNLNRLVLCVEDRFD